MLGRVQDGGRGLCLSRVQLVERQEPEPLLAYAIKALDHQAKSEGFRCNGWFGLQSKDVNRFLQDNPTPDLW